MTQPFELTLSAIGKVYPGVVALQEVSLTVHQGEVVGLIGENGAGKSTLMKVLGGVESPDSGHIRIDGQRYTSLTPAGASELGIAFVHQELNPFTNLDVAGNVLLGREPVTGPLRLLDRKAMVREVAPILTRLGTRFGAQDPVAGLSLADQQLLEIARALSMRARLIILDEPTSSLTLAETTRLLDVVAELRTQGVAFLFITHRLSEIEQVADRVVALRDGCNAGELAQHEIDRDRMVRMMIGRDVASFQERTQGADSASVPVLELAAVRSSCYPEQAVSVTVKAGEILALAGLVGAGRTELALAAFGVDSRVGGTVRVAGQTIPAGSVAAAIASGLCLVPENRKEQGLFLDFAIASNIAMPNLARLTRRGLVDLAEEQALAEDSRQQLAIKAASLQRPAAELSGGNQQKVVLAKWLSTQPRAVIFDEPTRGIDVGSKAEVYQLMRKLAGQGVGILMISSDMEEVIGVSDRVAVMSAGQITGILDASELTEEAILRLAVQ